MASWPGEYLISGVSGLRKNKWNRGGPGRPPHRIQAMLSAFSFWKLGSGLIVYLLNTLFLFLVTIELGLAECFLGQATAEPIFIILEISMSHKTNLQPTVPSMGVPFLALFKIKGKMRNLEPSTWHLSDHILSPMWRILLWYFKVIQGMLSAWRIYVASLPTQ